MSVLTAVFLAVVGGVAAWRDGGLPLHYAPNPPVATTQRQAPEKPAGGWSVKEPQQTAEFISGPVAASVGELCVFRLNDPATRADWLIVPEATCYIDTSGSSLAFAWETELHGA